MLQMNQNDIRMVYLYARQKEKFKKRKEVKPLIQLLKNK